MKDYDLGHGNTNDLTNYPFRVVKPVLKTNPIATFYWLVNSLLVDDSTSTYLVTLVCNTWVP